MGLKGREPGNGFYFSKLQRLPGWGRGLMAGQLVAGFHRIGGFRPAVNTGTSDSKGA